MSKESNVTEVPKKKRGRPPGSKKIAGTVGKIKQAPKSKATGKGKRYSIQDMQTATEFIQSHGRGGISLAVKKFKVSYPTLAKWMKEAGSAKGPSKAQKSPKTRGRPMKTKTAPSGHVLISKATIKEFQKGLANLEIAFGNFANALRILE